MKRSLTHGEVVWLFTLAVFILAMLVAKTYR